jgi:hypothetical protein
MTAPKKKSAWGLLELTVLAVIIGFFFWVSHYANFVRGGTSPANTCINNLRQIEAAKNEWALEKGITNVEIVPEESDLTPYIQLNSNSRIPPCPSGGTYTIGKLKDLATCSLGTNVYPPHVLPSRGY